MCLVIVWWATTLSIFTEKCEAGFYMVDKNEQFVFGEDKICGMCSVDSCYDC